MVNLHNKPILYFISRNRRSLVAALFAKHLESQQGLLVLSTDMIDGDDGN
jgi:hypothetical protein